ncbi:uncharacterized protein LOC134855891 [Symsagittifera roscoffensis]|uniref:uncharacterized protein LOC134855891 n=1 Tax=Symsagittifera roscoffensis TaxID=84072 RepID=UPI00307B15F5
MIFKPLLVLGVLSTFMSVALAGSSYLCTEDVHCQTQVALNGGGENVECCSDDKCHPNCNWELWAFLIFFIALPISACVCCTLFIGGIVYCIFKAAKNDNQIVSPASGVYYTSAHQPQPSYASPPSYSPNQMQPPKNPTPQPEPQQPQSSSESEPPSPPADYSNYQRSQVNFGFVQS